MSVRVPGARAWVAAGALALLLAGTGRADGAEGTRPLRLKAGTLDPVSLPARAETTWGAPARVTRIVQAREDAESLRADLERAGVEIVGYLPDAAWIVRVPAERAGLLDQLPGVRWTGEPRAQWKRSPGIGRRSYKDRSFRAGGMYTLDAELWPDESTAVVAAELAAIGADVLHARDGEPWGRIRLRVAPSLVDLVAVHPAVAWVEEAAEFTPRNDTTHWVIQSNSSGVTSVWDQGLHGEGQILGHIDGRIDMDSCYFQDPVDNTPGPAHRKVVAYRSTTGTGTDTHGTHTAGVAAGDQFPISGSAVSNGNAWAARISFTNLDDIPFGSGADLYDALAAAHADGARVHNNSWGDDGFTGYTSDVREVDRFADNHEDDLVVFAVSNLPTIQSPENAKNCLAVAASKNGALADDYCDGGTGPTTDGRRKPDVFAPGCGIVSARAAAACLTLGMTGTSQAAPAVSAAALLTRQYFTEGWYPSGVADAAAAFIPTGALLKAAVVNSAVDMTGIAGYPGDQEGWGRILLENALYFPGDARDLRILDVRNGSGLATGGFRELRVNVASSAEPLRVSLVWTDPPAALMASQAWIDDLDLEVRAPDDTLYRGNVFSGGVSAPGGSADGINNLEQVLILAPAAGDWKIGVRGSAVPQGPQGYAVVVTGDLSDLLPGEAALPGEPAFRIGKGEAGGYDLLWSPPAGGGVPTSYVLYRTPLGSWIPSCDGPLGAGTAAHRAALPDGGFVVVARNAAGEGPYGAGRTAAAVVCP